MRDSGNREVTTQAASNRREVSYVDVDASRAGQRLDNFLVGRLKGVPKSRIYRPRQIYMGPKLNHFTPLHDRK